MIYITKSLPPRTPSLRAAAPRQRAAAKAAPPAAKPAAQADKARRRALLDAVGSDGLAVRPVAAKSAVATKRAATAKAAKATTKRSTTPKAAAAAPSIYQPPPPPKVKIGFPALPVQTRQARYDGPHEWKANLAAYRKFLRVACVVGEARRLTVDERNQIEIAQARVAEIKSVAGAYVR